MNTEVQAFLAELLAGQCPVERASDLEWAAIRDVSDNQELAGMMERLVLISRLGRTG